MNKTVQISNLKSLMLLFFTFIEIAFSGCNPKKSQSVTISKDTIKISKNGVHFFVNKKGFRFGFSDNNGNVLVSSHPQSGLLSGDPDHLSEATDTKFLSEENNTYKFSVVCDNSSKIQVELTLDSAMACFLLENQNGDTTALALRTAGVSPGYGLADHIITWQFGKAKDSSSSKAGTDITGFVDDHYNASSGHITRMVNNFAIYPSHHFALINIDPNIKMVRSTKEEILQGSRATPKINNFYYFFGDPATIYKNFWKVRNSSGYPIMKPKYDFYGVGWEAYGALGWKTNEKTVTQDVDKYLQLGYPLTWMIIGSGFWPDSEDRYKSTTSFGMWDPRKYPDPQRLKDHFHKEGLKIMLGLRIAFITKGPFSNEGLEKGYFIQENGKAKVFKIGFPRDSIYMLDGHNSEAVKWYVGLCDKWGVDGFKEDMYGYTAYDLPDDKLNAVNEALMKKGYYVMVRNNYVASPGELFRINDFNYDMDQDRGPVNSLAFAYSGLPMTYFDIVGGLFGGRDFDGIVSDRIKTYMMRNMRTASLHSAVSMGKGPWHFKDEKVSRVMLDAAKLHGRLQPYFYSQAIRFYHDGYPWSMTPLPIAFPDDPQVNNRENNVVRGYEWMIGDALLAYPLYGEDYETATSRDVYLPKGKWIDYDDGKLYQGPQLLQDFEIPVEKTPLFVGGTGIVIEKIDDQLIARIYAVSDRAETIFYDKDGETASQIVVDHPDWTNPNILDTTTGKNVGTKQQRHAFEFELDPGHDYVIK